MRRRVLKVSLAIVLIGLGSTTFYCKFFLRLVRVPTGAMANTIVPGDHLVVKERGFGEVVRGDLVVFKYPAEPGVSYLARVVGLSGESIQIQGKAVFINGKELPEVRTLVKPNSDFKLDVLQEISTEGAGSYRVFYTSDPQPGMDAGGIGTSEPFRIPDNQYFMLGDNRDNSADSRLRGPVPRDLIIGKPFMIYWSYAGQPGEEKIRWNRIFKSLR